MAKKRLPSKNGIVSAILSNHAVKVLLFSIFTKECKSCKYWKNEKDAPEYE